MTNEYTPTDQVVREDWVSFQATHRKPINTARWGREFDRWLAAHDAGVRATALEEAIKLLDPATWESVNSNRDIGEPGSWREHAYAVQHILRDLMPEGTTDDST